MSITQVFTNIANAIRAKTGKSASMTPLEMPEEIASISGGGVVFEKEVVSHLEREQSANPVPVSVTFTKNLPIAFVVGTISDNVNSNGQITFDTSEALAYISYQMAGFVSVKNKEINSFFPYSDGGAWYDFLGAVGMSKLPSDFEIHKSRSTTAPTFTLSKSYEHIVVFVTADGTNSTFSATVNSETLNVTNLSYLYNRYTHYGITELDISDTTLSFTYNGNLFDLDIVVFAYDE